VVRDTLDGIIKLLKKSPRGNSCFETLETAMAPDTPGIRTLYPIRWTFRVEALRSVLDNYEGFMVERR